MDSALLMLLLVVVVTLLFDYVNGMHDCANAIATVVATGVLPLRTAVLLSAAFNFAGAFVGLKVAGTIAKGFADPAVVTQLVVLSALSGAILWNLLTWWWGIPSSSSHALIGGLTGAIVMHAGPDAFHWVTLKDKVLIPLVRSPTIGFAVAVFLMLALLWTVHLFKIRPDNVHKATRRMQLVSSLAMSVSHGSNDAQKSMGIILMALVAAKAAGLSSLPAWIMPDAEMHVPPWVIISCATAMALGTFSGGARIIKTMGTKIFDIEPSHGFAAETAAATTIIVASLAGNPVSTTHCIAGSLMGAGATKRLSAVRWGVAGNIVKAWVFTMPAAAICAGTVMFVLDKLF